MCIVHSHQSSNHIIWHKIIGLNVLKSFLWDRDNGMNETCKKTRRGFTLKVCLDSKLFTDGETNIAFPKGIFHVI